MHTAEEPVPIVLVELAELLRCIAAGAPARAGSLPR
jgi:hypothetical protein